MSDELKKENDKNTNWMMAGLAYVAFVIPFFSSTAKKDEFVKYHIKQAVVFVVVVLALQGVLSIWGYWMLPGITLLVYLLRALYAAGIILGFMNAQRGSKCPLPIIGKYAERL